MLGKNRRSTSPILQTAFALVNKNPPVFGGADRSELSYRRTPLRSAREEDAINHGKMLPTFPVEAVASGGKEAEASDVVSIIEETRRRTRCHWKDFGVLYRSHIHRDDVVQRLAEREIPFSIENMDVSDTPEVRDLFACVAVVVDLASDANLFRVAALPQFDCRSLPASLRTPRHRQRLAGRSGHSLGLGTGRRGRRPRGFGYRPSGAR